MGLEIKMPKLGESLAEGTLVQWFKRVGDAVRRDEPLFEISTDKVDTEVPAPSDGYLSEVFVGEGETVPVNTVVCLISDVPASRPSSPAEPSKTSVQAAPNAGAGSNIGTAPNIGTGEGQAAESDEAPSTTARLREKSSPFVRRLAAEHGIDFASLRGSGKTGRVTKDDLLRHIQETNAGDPSAGDSSTDVTEALPETGTSPANDRIEPLSVMRRNIAQRMIESRRTSAHVSTIFEVDMTEVRRRRETLNEGKAATNRTSYFPFLLHAVAQTLRAHPRLNASIEGDSVRLHGAIHIGVAVALEDGLIVPVVRHADTKPMLTLAAEIRNLAERARTKKLLPDEVQGATFTITNPGVFGSLIGTPIIPQPQVAILCFGAVEKRPVVLPETDAIVVRSMSFLTLSFDHRLIDGAVADRFMAEIKNRLEATGQPSCAPEL